MLGIWRRNRANGCSPAAKFANRRHHRSTHRKAGFEHVGAAGTERGRQRRFRARDALQLHTARRWAGGVRGWPEYQGVEHLTVVQITTPDVLESLTTAPARGPR